MKGNNIGNNVPKQQPVHHQGRPNLRDDLDSRSNEEQDTFGDNETNNKKETKEKHLKEHDDDSHR